MAPHRERLLIPRAVQEYEEEELGLLGEGRDFEDSENGKDAEEQDWKSELEPEAKLRKTLWLRIVVITLSVVWSLGFIFHSFLVPRRIEQVPTATQAQLRPEEDYILDPEWNFDAEPTTREYYWTVAEHQLNPDGVYRKMLLINEMYPGPLIESNEGDEIIVHVVNHASNATSIHWHGLFMKDTNYMDGTVGITQCPIAPGHNFTYRFKLSGQSGTYWYHSHMGVQASDGLVGPLIIHSRNEREELQRMPYAQDRVVLVSDLYYDLSSTILVQYLEPGNENDEPVPPSAVINGRNTRNCADVPTRKCDSSNRMNALLDLASDRNTRLRFINVGALAEFQIQVDEHEVYVTEVDGTNVLPEPIHRLNINPAQRYSVIISPPTSYKELYWIRARMITHCFAYENVELKDEVWGVIRYSAPGDSLVPESLDWPDIIELECRDLNTSTLTPVVRVQAPTTVDDMIYIRSSFQIRDWRLSRGYLNDSSYRPTLAAPTLSGLLDAYKAGDENVTSLVSKPYGPTEFPTMSSSSAMVHPYNQPMIYTTSTVRTLDILVQNMDDGNHPFHLHGHTFFVLAQGHGYPPSNLHQNLNLTNPLRRDTASVEAFGWTLLRFVADNPGVWAFHCHISWHNEAGLLMQFVTRIDELVQMQVPDEVKGLCTMEGIEKGAGPDDSHWLGSGLGGNHE